MTEVNIGGIHVNVASDDQRPGRDPLTELRHRHRASKELDRQRLVAAIREDHGADNRSAGE